MSEVSFADFKKIDLRVAVILSVSDIEGADKIYKLEIDLGSEKKQIVAGIKAHYKKEELVGRRIVVVNNLEAAVIRGVESKGMLLGAKDATAFSLLGIDEDLPAGTLIG